MIILSPVSKYRIEYEVAEGVPYSHLDRMIHKAVQENLGSLAALEKTFRVHKSLIIQSLVNLTQIGWIALGTTSDQQFVITPAGKAALAENDIAALIQRTPRKYDVFLDLVTGAVLPFRHVPSVSTRFLKAREMWDRRICLKPEIPYSYRLDEGEIIHMLDRPEGKRIYSVKSIENIIPTGLYILIIFDENNQQILNLPSYMSEALMPYVVEKAKELAEMEEAFPDLEPEDRAQIDQNVGDVQDVFSGWLGAQYQVDLNPDKVFIGQEQHEVQLHRALAEAQSVLFIASSLVSREKMNDLYPSIRVALEKGVEIHILRGIGSKSETESRNWFFTETSDFKNLPGSIKTNYSSVASNARFMIWDTTDDCFVGIVGSYDWLAPLQPVPPEVPTDVGIELESPDILLQLTRFASDLWQLSNNRNDRLSSVPSRWKKISADLENMRGESQDTSCPGKRENLISELSHTKAQARLCLSREHPHLLQVWLEHAKQRLIIASAELDRSNQDLFSILFPLQKKIEITDIYYGHDRSLDQGTQDSAVNPANQWERLSKHMPGLNTRLMICDERVLISSFSFLSQEWEDTRDVRELGIIIDQADLAQRLSAILKGVAR